MNLEHFLLAMPWVALPVLVFFMPRILANVGLPVGLALSIVAIGVFSFWSALLLADIIYPPLDGIDCGFCQALSEMVAASLLLSAIGVGTIMVWNARKFEIRP